MRRRIVCAEGLIAELGKSLLIDAVGSLLARRPDTDVDVISFALVVVVEVSVLVFQLDPTLTGRLYIPPSPTFLSEKSFVFDESITDRVDAEGLLGLDP